MTKEEALNQKLQDHFQKIDAGREWAIAHRDLIDEDENGFMRIVSEEDVPEEAIYYIDCQNEILKIQLERISIQKAMGIKAKGLSPEDAELARLEYDENEEIR